MVVFVVAFAVHLGAVRNGFPNDDRDIVLENERVHALSSLPEAVSTPYWPIEFGADMGLWRPATVAAYSLQWAAFGDSATGYHVVNLILHAGTSVLVFLLTGLLVGGMAPLAAGLLFAVHPVHVEAVAGIVGLAELASAAAFLTACVLFLRWRDRLSLSKVAALAGLYALSVSFKESGVVLPLVLLVLDAFDRDPLLRDAPAALTRHRRLWGALAAVLVTLGALRAAVLGGLRPPIPPVGAELLGQVPRIYTAAATWPEYFRLLFFPWSLSADYSPGRIPVSISWTPAGLLGIALALGTLTLLWWAWRTGVDRSGPRRTVSLGGLIVGISLITTSNLFVLTGVLLAERTLYLPSVGVCLAAAAMFSHFSLGDRVARGIVWSGFAVLILAGGARTAMRVPVWTTTETLWMDVVRQQPENGRSHWVLGDALWRRGDRSAAYRAYGKAVGLLGGDQLLLTVVAERLLEAGRPAQAEVLARQAWEKRPGYDAAPGLLAVALLAQGRGAEAVAPATASLDADPTDSTIHMLLAQAYRSSDRPGPALGFQREAIRLGGGRDPDDFGPWLILADLERAGGNLRAVESALDSAAVRGAPAETLRQIGRDAGLKVWEQRSR